MVYQVWENVENAVVVDGEETETGKEKTKANVWLVETFSRVRVNFQLGRLDLTNCYYTTVVTPYKRIFVQMIKMATKREF